VTGRVEAARWLPTYHGVESVVVELAGDSDTTRRNVGEPLRPRGLVGPGATVVFVSVNPVLARPDANFLKLQRLA
jgi:hypothetical protein